MGYYSTAEEAALAYSRSVGKEAAEREVADVWAPQMTAAEVMAAADAEGLALVQSKENKCGYLCVSARDGAFDVQMPANALVTGEDRQVRRTRFRTVEAAALAVARMLGPEQSNAQQAAFQREVSRVHLSSEQARAAAAAEDLTLVRAKNKSGFSGVFKFRRYGATSENCWGLLKEQSMPGEYVRRFSCPEAAALEYARALGPSASKAKEAAYVLSCMTKEEAEAAAAAEGLPLVRSSRNHSGFKGVFFAHVRSDRPVGRPCSVLHGNGSGEKRHRVQDKEDKAEGAEQEEQEEQEQEPEDEGNEDNLLATEVRPPKNSLACSVLTLCVRHRSWVVKAVGRPTE